MKKPFLTYLVLSMGIALSAQETHVGHYYYNEKQEEIKINSNVVLVYFRTSQMDSINIRQNYRCLRTMALNGEKSDTLYACEVILPRDSYEEGCAWLREQPEVYDVEPIIGTDTRILVSNVIYVKLREESDTMLLKSKAAQYGARFDGAVFNSGQWYQLSVNKYTTLDALSLSNQMVECGVFSKIDPGFVFDIEMYGNCVSDENFGSQWGLDAINACDAWGISTGSSNIKLLLLMWESMSPIQNSAT